MEEILASIRKIIADDDALPLTRPSGEARSTFATPKPFEVNVTSLAPRSAPPPPVREPAAQPLAASAPPVSPPRSDAAAPSAAAPVVAAPAVVAPQQSEAPVAQAPEVLPPIEAGKAATSEAAFEDPDLASFAQLASELSLHDLRPAIDEASSGDMTEIDDALASVDADAALLSSGAANDAGEPSETPVILSPEADASVSSAFRALSASVELANSETIDRHVRDMLRPMLKQWLDDNLPVMVERMVRAEIERVARGGR